MTVLYGSWPYIAIWPSLDANTCRTVLGTYLPGIGFNAVYERQPDGVWFPATVGTEFCIRVIFFINRDVSITLENNVFEHTHVESRMKVVGPAD